MNFEEKVKIQTDKYESLIAMKNEKSDFYNGIFDRYKNPVLTRNHVPLFWKYDMDPVTNPFFMERLGVNAVMNSGALYVDGKFYLVARVEGADRKSFFAVAESTSGVDGFRWITLFSSLTLAQKKQTFMICGLLSMKTDGFTEFSVRKAKTQTQRT